MEHFQDIIRRVEAYREAQGWSEATVGNKAAGSARLLPRFRRRVQQIEMDIERLEQLMAANPPAETAEDAA